MVRPKSFCSSRSLQERYPSTRHRYFSRNEHEESCIEKLHIFRAALLYEWSWRSNYKHTDATGRYGEELANRIRSRDVILSDLRSEDLIKMKWSGVKVTELQEQAKKLGNITATK